MKTSHDAAQDMNELERITDQIEKSTDTKPSAGQVASVIVQNYLRSGLSRCKEPAESLTATAQIHEQIAAVAVAASEIKHDVDSRMQDLVAALQREREEQS